MADFITANADSFVGIDLADQELDYPGREFAQLFRKAKARGLGITIHAGEISVEESRINVRDAIEQMAADRIGHGLHIINDPDLIQLVIDNDITLELCPTSNLLTGSIPAIEDHPFKKLMDAGVKTTINTDDPSLFAIDWNSEYAVAKNALCLSPADINQCIENAKAASFINADTINKAWGAEPSSISLFSRVPHLRTLQDISGIPTTPNPRHRLTPPLTSLRINLHNALTV